ncbi:phosphate-starvation-inducible PsiE family protein [uncultured Thiodictyon sp.]|uniref:phosphate-starvation-inducible protein PsiE n=1 Tax=uncultured Thiodictyon sp. TaxID=1846217 RepID=UPI0025F7FB3B|nr:phosphate-starvation-inducible PsiE family protein [uncultured Thiodictyon sp.]
MGPNTVENALPADRAARRPNLHAAGASGGALGPTAPGESPSTTATGYSPRILDLGGRMLGHFELVFLAVISIATVIASAQEVVAMVGRGQVALADLLLLFIYLEVLSMVAVYLDSGALPVRIPLYIAMVALARHIILDMKELTELGIAASAFAVLILAGAVLMVRFGQVRFPYQSRTRSGRREPGND